MANKRVRATFEVQDWDEHAFDRRAGAAKLTRARVRKRYRGDLAGESVTQWVMAYADDGSATFVGIERIDGTVGKQSGTLALRHVGTFSNGAARAELTVVEGAGSGDLAAASGKGKLVADPSGSIELELRLG